MQFNKLHTVLFFIVCAAFAACTDEVSSFVSPDKDGRIPIELNVGGVDAHSMTRAVVTDGTTNTTFGSDTKIFLLMQSDKDATVHDGYEYKGDRAATLYTVARANVVHATSATDIIFDDVNKKYWDDAHARSSQLTVWAFAQRIATSTDRAWPAYSFQSYNGVDPSMEESNKQTYDSNTSYGWFDDPKLYPAIFSWNVGNGSSNQDANTLIYQDLFFSNNIVNYVGNEKVPEGSRTDNRMKFNFSTHKFPESTQLKFYHAMSKITIQLKAGKGFLANGTDFKLRNNTVDLLHGFNTRGLFNIKDGEFQMIHEHADISAIPLTKTVVSKSEPYYTLEALAIPNIHQFLKTHSESDTYSRFVDGSADIMLEITVDDNTYKITSNDLFDAITGKTNATTLTDNGTYVPLEAGKNYVFTFTIGKQQIDNLTAHVADWEEVVADEQIPSNARITLSVEDRSGSSSTSEVTSNMDIYRALDESPTISDTYEGYNWTTKYNTDGKATWNGNPLAYNTDRWSTDWFWESNKTYYHFRTLSPSTQDVTTDGAGDYTTISSSFCADADSYEEMSWGAPFFDVDPDYNFTYSTTKGFDGTGSGHQIYKAIGPTKDQVKILMFHMFCGVHFTIKTTGGADKVQLYNTVGNKHTKIDLVGYYPDGKVLLGTGLVNVDGTISTVGSPYNISCATSATAEFGNQDYYLSAIPQDLTSVKLYITTPDNNQYIVDLGKVKATTVNTNNIANPYTQGSDSKYTIDRWYPGFKYNYSFTLAKTGITNLQATIVDWETVTAEDETVQIK